MKLYSIELDGKLVQYETEPAYSDFSTNIITTIVAGDGTLDGVWVCSSALQAEWVRLHSTPWYSSSRITPKHYSEDFTEQLKQRGKVVSFTMNVVEKKVSLPTLEEMSRTLNRDFSDQYDYYHLMLYQLEISKGKL